MKGGNGRHGLPTLLIPVRRRPFILVYLLPDKYSKALCVFPSIPAGLKRFLSGSGAHIDDEFATKSISRNLAVCLDTQQLLGIAIVCRDLLINPKLYTVVISNTAFWVQSIPVLRKLHSNFPGICCCVAVTRFCINIAGFFKKLPRVGCAPLGKTSVVPRNVIGKGGSVPAETVDSNNSRSSAVPLARNSQAVSTCW